MLSMIKSIPSDARVVISLAITMAGLWMLWPFVPRSVVAQIGFSTAVAGVTVAISLIVEAYREILGFICQTVASAVYVFLTASIVLIVLSDVDPTAYWYIGAGFQQGVMAISWAMLWRVRKRWLSRNTALGSLIVTAAGFAWFLHSSLGLADPITNPAQWHLPDISTVHVSPWIQTILFGGLLGWVLILGQRWIRRNAWRPGQV